LEHIALLNCKPEEHLSFTVSTLDLSHFDSALAYNLIHYPKLLLDIFNESLLEALTALVKHPSLFKKHGAHGSIKKRCHIRIVSLPPIAELNKDTISHIKSNDVNHLIQISGTIVRTGSVQMLIVSKEYQCMNSKCAYRFRVHVDPEQGNTLPTPRCCPAFATGNISLPGGIKCNSVNIREIEGSSECVDYQEIKLQDRVSATK
jgi:DNA replicative helicase MCM subunit Mcm2 (Cdc46/Mcm family)